MYVLVFKIRIETSIVPYMDHTVFSSLPVDAICIGDNGNKYFTDDIPDPKDILLLLVCIIASLVLIMIDFAPSVV